MCMPREVQKSSTCLRAFALVCGVGGVLRKLVNRPNLNRRRHGRGAMAITDDPATRGGGTKGEADGPAQQAYAEDGDAIGHRAEFIPGRSANGAGLPKSGANTL